MSTSVVESPNATSESTGRRIEAPPATERLLSLDVFRGLTIAAMILVNNPGSWSHIYAPLKHAEWHGWTPTDLIFPFFLFIVGVAITYSIGGKIERGESPKSLVPGIIRRSAILFGLGLFLNGFPFFPLDKILHIRIPGVLQRIALCFLFASLIYLKTRVRGLVIWTLALLAVYWLLMKFVPVPGVGAGDLSAEGSLEGYLDVLVMRGHIYRPTYDPEGLLSTIPAIATTLTGILTGHWLKSPVHMAERASGMLIAGIVLISAGKFMDLWFPINKSIWTSSYVVFTTGAALLVLGMAYWLIDLKGYRTWAKPFIIFGSNAIAVFVGSGILARVMALIKWTTAEGISVDLKTFIYKTFFVSWAGELNGSLAYASTYILFWLMVMTVLYRKKIFLKV
jgi:predicted acyltransferase